MRRTKEDCKKKKKSIKTKCIKEKIKGNKEEDEWNTGKDKRRKKNEGEGGRGVVENEKHLRRYSK